MISRIIQVAPPATNPYTSFFDESHAVNGKALRFLTVLGFAVVVSLSLPTAARADQKGNAPLKVFILAGQSNMEGVCHISTIDFLGEDKEHGHLLKNFKPDGKTLVTRDDVWVANRGHYGKLAPGYGARRGAEPGSRIGPEYAFGYHYFGSGRFFILVGKTFADTMLELLDE